jgi:hypothetical protein
MYLFFIISAEKQGLPGNRVVFAVDGFQINDDEDLVENSNNQLMILDAAQQWAEEELTHKSISDGDQNCSTTIIEANDIIPQPIVEQNEAFIYEVLVDDTPMSSGDQKKFDEFQLPWAKLPSDLLLDIEAKKMFKKPELCAVANIFVSELQQINPQVKQSVLLRVATEAANSFPDSFLQKDESGKLLSPKPVLLLAKMIARRNYNNRKPQKKKHTIQEITKDIKQCREAERIAKTVFDYQPNIIGQEANMEMKRCWLKGVYNTSEATIFASQVTEYMSDTYGLQRKHINENSEVENVFEKWPFLQDTLYLKNHFQQLTSADLENFEKKFQMYKAGTISYLSRCNHKTMKKMLPSIATNHVDIRILKLLAAYFKEDYTYLARHFQVLFFFCFFCLLLQVLYSYSSFQLGTTVQQMKEQVDISTPFVAVVGKFVFKK